MTNHIWISSQSSKLVLFDREISVCSNHTMVLLIGLPVLHQIFVIQTEEQSFVLFSHVEVPYVWVITIIFFTELKLELTSSVSFLSVQSITEFIDLRYLK